ncbi:hypothetical protein IV203_008047 [Nitzschia inconspicua]|uniref:Uncharacterized protein n=1 Tax=Nitzschia inconspicua TaxID=303405 RepID=A0A9K3KYX7_9STRA|nr:hypothetical protein IV203_008047 [Nitzschia inconspicua]
MPRRSKRKTVPTATTKKKGIEKNVPNDVHEEEEDTNPVVSSLPMTDSSDCDEAAGTATPTSGSNNKKRKAIKEEEEEENASPAEEHEKVESNEGTRPTGRAGRRRAANKMAKQSYAEVEYTTDEESESDDDFEGAVNTAKNRRKGKPTSAKKSVKPKASPKATLKNNGKKKDTTVAKKNKNNDEETPLSNAKEAIANVWKPSHGDWRAEAGIDY